MSFQWELMTCTTRPWWLYFQFIGDELRQRLVLMFHEHKKLPGISPNLFDDQLWSRDSVLIGIVISFCIEYTILPPALSHWLSHGLISIKNRIQTRYESHKQPGTISQHPRTPTQTRGCTQDEHPETRFSAGGMVRANPYTPLGRSLSGYFKWDFPVFRAKMS